MENLSELNSTLKDSSRSAFEHHASYNQPIIYRDDKNRLVEEYADGRIVVIIDYNKTV